MEIRSYHKQGQDDLKPLIVTQYGQRQTNETKEQCHGFLYESYKISTWQLLILNVSFYIEIQNWYTVMC